MKSIKNEKLIKRNSTIGNWANLGAIVILGVSMYTTLGNSNNPDNQQQSFLYTGIALIVGFILLQVGNYMLIRFGRSPRPDEKLDAGLKGLPNEFVMYHYTTPVPHLLLGPAGLWVIQPYHQSGQVTFRKNRWRISGGGFAQAYMRVFGQEGLGRPDIEIESETYALKKFLSKKMDESEIPEINTLMVFTSDNVELDSEGAPILAMKLKQVKEFIRQKAKEKKLPAETLDQLKTVFE